MPGIVHPIADRGCRHLVIGIIAEQLQGVLTVRGLIQPLRVVVGLDDDGHPFMDGLHDARGLGGDDGAGIQRALVVIPMLPQPGKSKKLLVLAVDVKGFFAEVGGCRFVKAAGND